MNYLRCVCGLEMSARCATWTADADVRKRRAISSPAGAGAMPIPLVWRHATVSVAAVSMSRTRCFSRAVSTGRQTARQRNTAISTRISGRHVTVAELVMPAHAARSFVAMAIARAMGTTEPPSEGTTETVSAAAASAASTYPETASRACAKVSLSPHCVAAFTSVRAASERAAVVAAASRAAAPSHARNVSSGLRSSSLWEATSLDHLSREIKCEPGLRRCVLSTQWCSRTSSKLPRRLDFTGGASAA